MECVESGSGEINTSFREKAALIVGGGSGMGFETARLLLESGAEVTLVGRSQEKLDHARKTLQTIGKVHTFRYDLIAQR